MYQVRRFRKIKSKRVCRSCQKVYFKNDKFSDKQWLESKSCSNQCSGNLKRIHENNKIKLEAYRRKKRMLKQGSKESNVNIAHLTALAMEKPEVQEKIRQPRGSMSLEQRMEISDKLKGKMPKNATYSNNEYAHILRGYYDINGTTFYFRSKWEANYALYLDFLINHKEIIKWEYEPDTFFFEKIKLGTRSYTPDFKIFNNKKTIEYHEVKGYMDSKSKTKLKRMAKYYPEISMVLIDTKTYNSIKKAVGKILKFY